MARLADAHDHWALALGDSGPFHPDGTDYNMHYLDIEDAGDEWTHRAEEILAGRVEKAAPGLARHHDDREDHHAGPDYGPRDIGLSAGALRDIEVDPRSVRVDRRDYQRPLDYGRVREYRQEGRKKLRKRWGLAAVRPDGTIYVINGQHHTAAAIEKHIPTMRYRAFDSTGPQQERQVYQNWQAWHDKYEEQGHHG